MYVNMMKGTVMAKKKVEKNIDEQLEEASKEFLKDVTNGQIYEGLVVLDSKLDTLINLFGKVVEHIEKKEKGQLTIG